MNIDRLNQAMRLRGVNDPALCAALGIRRCVIGGWRRTGAPRVTAERLYQCAEVLRVPAEWLAGRRDLWVGPDLLAGRWPPVEDMTAEERLAAGLRCLEIIDQVNAADPVSGA